MFSIDPKDPEPKRRRTAIEYPRCACWKRNSRDASRVFVDRAEAIGKEFLKSAGDICAEARPHFAALVLAVIAQEVAGVHTREHELARQPKEKTGRELYAVSNALEDIYQRAEEILRIGGAALTRS